MKLKSPKLTWRTRRRLKTAGIILGSGLALGLLVWLCWVLWLGRFVVYSRDAVRLDFDWQTPGSYVAALPPETPTVSIVYDDGSETVVQRNQERTQLNGCYITAQMLIDDIAGVDALIRELPKGTAIMLELKNGSGTFYYDTELPRASVSSKIDKAAMKSLLSYLAKADYYTIAKIPAFRDRAYGLKNVPQGIYHVNKKGLWPDNNNCYWLNPTNPTVLSYISSIVQELKEMDFDEVLLADFSVPVSDKVYFKEDRTEALKNAANTIIESCGSEYFTISFGVTSSTFPLPEGRTRMYLSGVEAQNVGAVIAQSKVENAEIRIVFLADTNDTRYDEYGVMRPLTMAPSKK